MVAFGAELCRQIARYALFEYLAPMKLTSSIQINRPVQEVWDFINDSKKMSEWQQGYTSTERLEGEPATKGARARHTYTERGRPFVMTETVLDSRPPYAIDIVLDHPTMDYHIATRLREDTHGATRVQMDSEVKMKAFSFKVLKPLLKKPFQKRQDKDLERLKEIMEKKTPA